MEDSFLELKASTSTKHKQERKEKKKTTNPGSSITNNKEKILNFQRRGKSDRAGIRIVTSCTRYEKIIDKDLRVSEGNISGTSNS